MSQGSQSKKNLPSGTNALKLGSVEKIAKFSGGKRVSAEAVKNAQNRANVFVDGVLAAALTYVEASKRKTLFHDDVVRGFEQHAETDYELMIERLNLNKAGSALKSPSKDGKSPSKGRQYEYSFIHIESTFSRENLRNYANKHLGDLRVEPQALLTLMNLVIVHLSVLFSQAGHFAGSNGRNTIKEKDLNGVSSSCNAKPNHIHDFSGRVPRAPAPKKSKSGSASSPSGGKAPKKGRKTARK